MPTKALAVIVLCILGLPVACGGGGGGGGDSPSELGSGGGGVGTGISVQTLRAVTDADGNGPVEFDIPAGTNKFAVNVVAPGAQIKLASLTSSSGQEYIIPGGTQISLSSELFTGINTAVAPSRAFDPPVSGPDHFKLQVVTQPGMIPFDVTVQTRSDSDLHHGTLHVNVFHVGPAAATDDVRATIDQALVVMRRIYSEQAGIDLAVSELDTSGPANLPNPINGDELYRVSSAGAPTPAVNLFIGGDVDVGAGPGAVLGVAAGLPAPTIPSTRSATAVSLLNGGGPDGVFDDNEIRLLGETFAHEVGHYLGLFHPIDFNEFFVVTDVDVLPDTAGCVTVLDCAANPDLVKNVMFPLPVNQDLADLLAAIAQLLKSDATVPQDTLTVEQANVMNLNPLVE